ncbi:phosphodiester glycosidase family protein [Streptomyces sp. NPDC089799]|uniref:phosphodiester glycosidase family protein n=1 Tax=Streptomyces sp. NPDC089799 TaxID=3155066 RepID=UPI0034249765
MADGYADVVERHPRTLARVTATGELLLVTIDGRNPLTSIGFTLQEAADVMKWLGAKDALSLGAGGDTTLVANDTLYNHPTDRWTASNSTERKVSNAVVVARRSNSGCTSAPPTGSETINLQLSTISRMTSQIRCV